MRLYKLFIILLLTASYFAGHHATWAASTAIQQDVSNTAQSTAIAADTQKIGFGAVKKREKSSASSNTIVIVMLKMK